MARTEPDPALGRALRLYRKRAGLSQEVVAERSELTVSTLSKIENGREDAKWGNVRRIATAIGREVAEVAEAADRLDRGDRGGRRDAILATPRPGGREDRVPANRLSGCEELLARFDSGRSVGR